MANMEIWTPREPSEWMRALDQCAPYDFYHLPQYHALADTRSEGKPNLFVFPEWAYAIALPLLLRKIKRTGGLRDATSVYGYAGPVCSHTDVPEAVINNFQAALTQQLREMQIVNVFSRLHPLLTQRSLLAGLGEFRESRTVSIDLMAEPAAQRSKFRKAFKEGITRLRRQGLTVVHDREGRYLADFARIYHETMERVEAADRYYFSLEYLEKFWNALGSRVHLFMCLDKGRPVCGGLFTACHGIVQYHLGGTLNDALKTSPMKLLVDEVRLWGTSQGMRCLHLGGGLSPSPNDSLLHYKMGFSDRTHDFATWRWVIDAEAYDRLCAEKAASDEAAQMRVRSEEHT